MPVQLAVEEQRKLLPVSLSRLFATVVTLRLGKVSERMTSNSMKDALYLQVTPPHVCSIVTGPRWVLPYPPPVALTVPVAGFPADTELETPAQLPMLLVHEEKVNEVIERVLNSPFTSPLIADEHETVTKPLLISESEVAAERLPL